MKKLQCDCGGTCGSFVFMELPSTPLMYDVNDDWTIDRDSIEYTASEEIIHCCNCEREYYAILDKVTNTYSLGEIYSASELARKAYEVKKDSWMELVLWGKIKFDTIHDYIDQWHEGDSTLELYEFLGMNKDEYKLFLENPDGFKVYIRGISRVMLDR